MSMASIAPAAIAVTAAITPDEASAKAQASIIATRPETSAMPPQMPKI